MDIVEYAEKLCGRQLFEWEKRLLKELSIKPRDTRLYMIIGRRGDMCICNGPVSKK